MLRTLNPTNPLRIVINGSRTRGVTPTRGAPPIGLSVDMHVYAGFGKKELGVLLTPPTGKQRADGMLKKGFDEGR
ncbi:hypothetical protein Patl1_10742 [Pistacia atlantica]|uniref:Uncharacterized protein n=1 Tax=Pistacia atlantica TaxID=434234 RepID=A0ACC1A6B1_9ROSI|nr:hypothetical protein Patl1_10742 [Pistacia atlantica]